MTSGRQPGLGPAKELDRGSPPDGAVHGVIDTHCHLTLEELGAEPDTYWHRAQQAGVVAAVVIGIDGSTSRGVVEYVEARDGLFAAVGVHPNSAGTATSQDLDTLRELAAHDKVVALGESGLDFYWDTSPRADQERWLDQHVELALELDLPLVLHIRDAYPEAATRLESAAEQGLRGVIHCFGGQAEEVDPFVSWGWPISFSGILTYGKADNVRGAARRTPLDQCLVETDSPWLTPARHRGATNEPAFVVEVVRKLAEVKDVSLEEAVRSTTANAVRAFGLPATLTGE